LLSVGKKKGREGKEKNRKRHRDCFFQLGGDLHYFDALGMALTAN